MGASAKRTAGLSAAVALVATAGCGGGSLDANALEKSAEAVHSTAAEGALVARDAAAGDTLGTFLSVQTEALGESAAEEATTLRSGEANGDLARRAEELARIADEVGRLLARLSDASSGEAATIADDLGRAAARADELGSP